MELPLMTVFDASYVLLRESQHFWQQVVVIKVLQVVDGVQNLLIIRRNVLNFIQDILILEETLPKERIVVD